MELKEISQLLYQLKLANQEMTSIFEKATGFSLTRYELMRILVCKGKCSQTQLQAALRIDSAAVTRHLKQLEEKNYVVRKRNEKNNREVFVEVTTKAQEELERCAHARHSEQDGLDIGLTEDEEEQLLSLLTKLTNNRGKNGE